MSPDRTEADRPPPLVGVRAFVVEATIAITPVTAGLPPTGIPGTQTFTLVLDADRRSGFIGAYNGRGTLTFDPTESHLAVKASFNYGCSNSVGIDELTIAVDASGRLNGSGKGHAFWAVTDIGHTGNATLTLTGHADQEPPMLRPATGIEPDDPFARFGILASEPLPNGVHPVLVSQDGERTTLGPAVGSEPAPAQWGFAMPVTSLRYGQTYWVATEGASDFAGNAARADADYRFTTRAPPPLVPEDGFDSATGETLGGGILFAGAAAPVIAGTKSLYLPTAGSFGPPRRLTTLALRLALKPGDKVVRFSYRLVTANSGFFTTATFGVASPGGKIVVASLPQPPTTSVATPVNIPGQGSLQALPASTGELALPPDAAGEIVFVRFVSEGTCGGPPSPIPGIIIDDLRVE
jgi:hypothetical protein